MKKYEENINIINYPSGGLMCPEAGSAATR